MKKPKYATLSQTSEAGIAGSLAHNGRAEECAVVAVHEQRRERALDALGVWDDIHRMMAGVYDKDGFPPDDRHPAQVQRLETDQRRVTT